MVYVMVLFDTNRNFQEQLSGQMMNNHQLLLNLTEMHKKEMKRYMYVVTSINIMVSSQAFPCTCSTQIFL